MAAPAAGAAVWQGPVPISDASVTAGDTPRLAIGGGGDAAVAWWDAGAGGRVLLARKPAGGAWSAPTVLGAATSPVTPLAGVDGSGNVTAVWSTGGVASVTTVATWPATAAAPTLATLDTTTLDMPEAATITDLAVNPAGVAVLAGESGTNNITLGYRATPTGPFAFSQKFGLTGMPNTPVRDPHVALNDAGSAIVIYRLSNTIFASRLSAAVPSFGPADAVNAGVAGGMGPADLSVAIDQAGNMLVGFTLTQTVGTSKAVGVAWRSPTGDWVAQWPLSPLGSLTSFTASFTSIVVNRAGTALLVWSQQGATPLDSIMSARVGSSATGIWGGIEAINDAGAFAPHPAIGDDGTAVVGWEEDVAGGQRVGRARIRTAAGVWSDTRTLDPPHLADSEPLIATDGHGHFATATSPDTGGAQQVLVSFLDMVAPVVSPVTLTGTAQVGDPLTMAVTASDKWSAIPSATWAFGDGATGSGLSVSHAYADAGVYHATVTVTDAAGNAASQPVAITITALQSALTSARLSGTWKQSRVKGTLVVKGVAPRAGTYVVDLLKGTTRKIHASFKLPAGAFSKSIALPAKLLPGSYHVSLLPGLPATQVKPASRDVKLTAPSSGVVDVSVLSGVKNGPAASTLKNVDTIWASFHFAAVPKGALKLTWYLTPKSGKRQNLGTVTKSATAKVVSFIRLGGRRGKVTAVIARKGVVIAQRSVNAK
jgi:hypothetical protein